MDSKIIKLSIIIFFITIKVFATEFNGKFIQGHFIIGNTNPNSKVIIDIVNQFSQILDSQRFSYIDREGDSPKELNTSLY